MQHVQTRHALHVITAEDWEARPGPLATYTGAHWSVGAAGKLSAYVRYLALRILQEALTVARDQRRALPGLAGARSGGRPTA